MLYLLLIPLLIEALVIHESNCIDDWCKYYLRLYLQQLELRFQTERVTSLNRYLTTITQSEPSPGMPSLSVNVYTIGSAKIEVTDLTGYKVDNGFKIYISLSETDINNPSKCSFINVDTAYINRECTFLIEYTSQIQSYPVKTYIYRMVVRIPNVPGHDYHVHGFLIDKVYEHKFVENFEYSVNLYKGESCREEITSETIVNYMDYICIGVFGNDVTTLFNYLDVAFLVTSYTSKTSRIRDFDMLSSATIKRSLDGENSKGKVYAVIPMIHLGKLRISMIITFAQRKTIRIELPESFEVSDPKSLFPKGSEENSAGSVVVSLITFLCLLTAIF